MGEHLNAQAVPYHRHPSTNQPDFHLRVLFVEESEEAIQAVLSYLKEGYFAVTHQRVDLPDIDRRVLDEPPWDILLVGLDHPPGDGPPILDWLARHKDDIPAILLGEESAVESMWSGEQGFILRRNLARLAPAINRAIRQHPR